MRTTQLLLPTAVAVVASGLTLVAPVQAAPAERRADAFEVTIAASTDELVLGERVTLKGKVTPKAAGQKVVLQKKIEDRKWVVERRTRLNERGRYTFKDEPSTAGSRKYRVVKPATRKHAKGVSPSVRVTTYRWIDLAALQPRDYANVYATTATIDTVEYPNSLVGWYDPAAEEWFRDYNLARECTTLDATYGMDDTADVDSSVQIDVENDGVNVYSKTFSLLESDPERIDIRGVFRLGFLFSTTGEGGSPRPVVGSPRALCAF